MISIGELLKEIRGKDTLRTAAKKTGLSFGYISILEKGVDPRSGSPSKPSPDTLRSYSKGYGYPFEVLMQVCGYSESEQKEMDQTLEKLKESDRKIINAYATLSPQRKKIIEDLINAFTKEDEE